MSKIQAIIGGKQKGIADQVTIDPAFGCPNKCVGCYAFKSSQRGKKFHEVVKKEFDRKVLEKSIRKVKSKGFNVARIGKHCDPGININLLNDILECCNSECIRCVIVSKSIPFNRETMKLLIDGDHLLHISYGPYTKIAPDEEAREEVATKYKAEGVKVAIRITQDITAFIRIYIQELLSKFDYIVTPMRYYSTSIMEFYGGKESSYKFIDGYWRPQKVHEHWKPYMKYVCGEIAGKTRCCNCLIDK